MKSPIKPIEVGQFPIARTNMLQLISASLDELLRKILQPVPGSNLHINCGIFQLQRNKGESTADYFTRVDARIREVVGKALGVKATVGIHYNRLLVDKGKTVFAYLGTKPQMPEQIRNQLQAEKVSLTRIIAIMIGLRLKMDFLLDANQHYEIQPVEYSAELFIGVMPISRSTEIQLFDALAIQIYLSEQQELVLTLERQVFACTAEVSTTSVVRGTTFMFFYGGKQYVAKNRRDARKFQGRKFMLFSNQDVSKEMRNDYRHSTNFHLNDCLNRLEQMLGQAGVEFEPIRFSATHQVREFLSPATACQRPLVVIDDYQDYASPQEQLVLHAAIESKLKPQRILIGKEITDPAQLPAEGVNYLVINQERDGATSIINRATGETYSTFWSACQSIDSKAGPALADFDLYTRMKYERFRNQKAFVCQGYDLAREKSTPPDQPGALVLDDLRLERIAYELWIKESVFDRKQVIVPGANYAPRQLELLSCRRDNDKRKWIVVADAQLEGSVIHLQKVARYDNTTSGEFDYRYPLLAKSLSRSSMSSFEALYNNSFMMCDLVTGCWLNVYSSNRVPQIIGNAAFDNIEVHFASQNVRRFTKAERNPLPYYLTPVSKKQQHFVFLQDTGVEGIRFFVSKALPANSAIDKQNRIYNVLVYGPDGERQMAFGHPLVEAFFASFTFDLLLLRESAKTSILEKVIDLYLEN